MEMESAEDTTIKFKLEKNTLTVSSDPLHHGFWQLNLDRGALPLPFRGRYTKRNQALAAAKAYMDTKIKD